MLLCHRRGSAFTGSRESQFPGRQWMSFWVWVEFKGLGLRLRRARGSERTSQEGLDPGWGRPYLGGGQKRKLILVGLNALTKYTAVCFLGIGLGGKVSNLLPKRFRKNNTHKHRQSKYGKMLTISESRWRVFWSSLYNSCNFCNFI